MNGAEQHRGNEPQGRNCWGERMPAIHFVLGSSRLLLVFIVTRNCADITVIITGIIDHRDIQSRCGGAEKEARKEEYQPMRT